MFDGEMVSYEIFSAKGIGTLMQSSRTRRLTSFPHASPSPARVRIATVLFVPE
jgi:hypothetical protein